MRRGTHGSLASCSALAGASVTTLGKGWGGERKVSGTLYGLLFYFIFYGYDRAVKTNLFLVRNFERPSFLGDNQQGVLELAWTGSSGLALVGALTPWQLAEVTYQGLKV